MKEHERTVIGGGFLLLLLGWLGFLVHSSPRFAGSALGSAFGIAGAVANAVSARLHNRETHSCGTEPN